MPQRELPPHIWQRRGRRWSTYAAALLTHFGQWVATSRQNSRGRLPKPRWQALPGLLYAQVFNRCLKGRVVSVTQRAICSSLETIETVLKLSGVSQIINTAFIEGLNLTICQHVAALGHKVSDLIKTIFGLKDQFSPARAYHNFCRAHASLRLPLPQPQPNRGNDSPKEWQPRTPAMAAGIPTTSGGWKNGCCYASLPGGKMPFPQLSG